MCKKCGYSGCSHDWVDQIDKSQVDRAVGVYEEIGAKYDIGYVYILQADNGLYKIGKTKTPRIRIALIRTASPVSIEIYQVFKSTEYHKAERRLHSLFDHCRERGEWFRLGPNELETINAIQGDHTLEPCYL